MTAAATTIAAIPNGRDLGGHRTSSGAKVRPGLVFRSAAPTDPVDADVLAALRVHHIYDLRTTAERDHRPDQVPASARVIHADLLADEPESSAASLGQIAQAAMAGDHSVMTAAALDAAFTRSYSSFVTLPSAQAATAAVLQDAADPAGGPLLLHCTAGKDRTGWLAALVLLALGVPEDDVMADYLASGPEVAALFAPYREQFAAQGGDVEAMDRLLGVFPHYLQAAIDTVAMEFGSVDGYLAEGLSLGDGFRDRLAERMLTG